MAGSSLKSKNTSLSPFLLSKVASGAGQHEKNGANKVQQLMPRASNDALGRIDTRVAHDAPTRLFHDRKKPLVILAFTSDSRNTLSRECTFDFNYRTIV